MAVISEKPRPDKRTVPVVSAGGVIFDAHGRVFLLRRADEGTWCFPKGHVEPGETLPETAAREIREECGLECTIGKEVAEVRYAYFWPPDDVNYDKRVVYHLASPKGRMVRLEDRFSEGRWVTPAAGLRLLHHKNDKHVLRKAVRAADLIGRA